MPEPLTISTAPPVHPAMEYAFLRREGIRHVTRLAQHVWTDHNTHDPGITILEQLCYAITDLSYRIQYKVPDLLASGAGDPYDSLYSPANILTCRPVTITDLRKLLIDLESVKNAWVEPVHEPGVPVYYDRSRHELWVDAADIGIERIELKGLYRVLIEKSDITDLNGSEIEQQVAARLHAHRGLCQDFDDIRVLDVQEIQLDADVEIETANRPEVVLAEVYHAVSEYISPTIWSYTLSELIEAGRHVEEVFDGPLLENGFIDSASLEGERRSALHASDLIRVIMDLPDVRAVRRLSLGRDKHQWSLNVDQDKVPRLAVKASTIRLKRGEVEVSVDAAAAEQLFYERQALAVSGRQRSDSLDFQPPRGRDRNVDRYYSMLHHFPAVYGVGEAGLPATATPQRKAQAKQLKAYLLFFDQVLANYFAQLSHLKNLFSFSQDEASTYFSQVVDAPELRLSEIRVRDAVAHRRELKTITEDASRSNISRRHRFLDHLLARFAEHFTDYSLLLFDLMPKEGITPDQALIRQKQAFLRSYPQLSSSRGTAFNYLLSPGSDNVSGVELRLRKLLGIEDRDVEFLASMEEEFESEVDRGQLLEHGLKIENYRFETGRITLGVDTESGRQILATSRTTYDDEEAVMDSLARRLVTWGHQWDERLYVVEHILLRPMEGDERQQAPVLTSLRRRDPYSLQLTFVFPDWPGRFQNEGFRQFVERTVREETPAHLMPYVLWLDRDAMETFETAHAHWIETRRKFWNEKLRLSQT